ncbi:gamma-aminobutyrate transaminase POP2 [Cucumis melo var. makuwa]|uniref:Gamma-aminobutyrate transaminase POP2 n=1 Tax=Cucumis melo var. makuwa TaxID=1194695 RepID=A0A5D3CQN4_CUCMM|nr:gamma-aminobutyrate transaminase POP2 [Cucumis melo var. makuwa]
MGPSFDVRCYNGCIVGELRFHTSELDSRRTTQSSGLMFIGEIDASGNGDNNFYGVLDEVLHVEYPIMSSSYPRNNFFETDAMFLEFADDSDNLTRGSSSMGDNSGSSSQPPATPTPRRRAQS